jgi:hypothetical protein
MIYMPAYDLFQGKFYINFEGKAEVKLSFIWCPVVSVSFAKMTACLPWIAYLPLSEIS